MLTRHCLTSSALLNLRPTSTCWHSSSPGSRGVLSHCCDEQRSGGLAEPSPLHLLQDMPKSRNPGRLLLPRRRQSQPFEKQTADRGGIRRRRIPRGCPRNRSASGGGKRSPPSPQRARAHHTLAPARPDPRKSPCSLATSRTARIIESRSPSRPPCWRRPIISHLSLGESINHVG